MYQTKLKIVKQSSQQQRKVETHATSLNPFYTGCVFCDTCVSQLEPSGQVTQNRVLASNCNMGMSSCDTHLSQNKHLLKKGLTHTMSTLGRDMGRVRLHFFRIGFICLKKSPENYIHVIIQSVASLQFLFALLG